MAEHKTLQDSDSLCKILILFANKLNIDTEEIKNEFFALKN